MTRNPDTCFASHENSVLRDGEHAVITFKGQVVGRGTFVVCTDEQCDCNDTARSLSMRFIAAHASRIERVLTFPTVVGSVIRANLKGDNPDFAPQMFWCIEQAPHRTDTWMNTNGFRCTPDTLDLVEVCFDAGKDIK